jgi:AraC-like DNA-binding protein/mannose-6-phosphate isomerase-like protein (cupin superfamily)
MEMLFPKEESKMETSLQASQEDMDVLVFQQLLCDDHSLGIYADLLTLTEPVAAHRHDFLEMAFMIKGCGQHEDVQGQVPLLSGDVWIIPPGQWHAYPFIEEGVSIFNLLLSQGFLMAYKPVLLSTHYLDTRTMCSPVDSASRDECILPIPAHYTRLSPQGRGSIHTLLMTLAEEVRRPGGAGYAGICIGLVLQIIGMVDRYSEPIVSSPGDTRSARHIPGLLTALRYIEERYAEPLTLEEIARHSGYVPTYLARKFRHHLGTSPIEYLFQVRLQHACTRLKTTDHSVSTIAYEVGFSDSRYFATRFRRSIGVTPSEFRIRYRDRITNREDNIVEA